MSNSTNSDLHVYIINSGFQLVSSVLLANERKNNLFICFEKHLYDSVKIQNSSWPAYEIKFKKLKGILGRRRGAKIYINKLFDILKEHQAKRYHFYMPVIAGSQYNYIINKSKKTYGEQNITVNIIPDGASNMMIEPFSSKKKMKRVQRKENNLIDRLFNLKYTPYHIDQHGIVSNAVNNIYTIPGLKHEYPINKCIDLPKIINTKHSPRNEKKALILGQTLVHWNIISSEEEKLIKDKITCFLSEESIKNIHYLPHTVATILDSPYELLTKDAKIISTKKPFELYMLDEDYDYIIATFSTALITAKLFFGQSSRVVSIGSNLISKSARNHFHKSLPLYHQIGVEVI